jgi:endonuclease YncB( thermonuclease family)
MTESNRVFPGDVEPLNVDRGIVPGLTNRDGADPARSGSDLSNAERSEQTVISDQTDGVNDLISQESGSRGPSRGTDELPRGTPINPDERDRVRSSYSQRGRARIKSLTELFGQDALVLGHLLFEVPPLAIRIKKGNIVYRWKPLRTKESIAIPSGNGECYIEIDLAFVGLFNIKNSLSDLIALWKKVPFCFIENIHIRKMMIPETPEDSMAVCLETMVMDAIAGQPNTVHATLITKWFNYKPYSKNFWFRSKWEPAGGNQPQHNRQGDGGPESGSGGGRRREEGNSNSPNITDRSRNVLTDLSSMQEIETIDAINSSLPFEVGLFESAQSENPGDPSIAGTFPVVYPFNSQPFLDRIQKTGDPAARISSWNDGIIMKWNRFIKLPVPKSFSRAVDRDPETNPAQSRSRDRSSERQPPPVTGDRDTILFIGDSTMVSFLGQNANPDATSGTVTPFFEFGGNSRFPTTDGFSYIGMCRNGSDSGTAVSWWNDKKSDSRLIAEGSTEVGSRLAGVVIHTGINDGSAGPNMAAIRTIASEASGFGAIPVILPLPPIGDATHITPNRLNELRVTWGDSTFETYQRSLADYHSEIMALVSSLGNADLIDYHKEMVEQRFRDNRAGPLAERYMNDVAGQPNYYAIVPNDIGKTAMGNYIARELPWSSLRGQPQTEDTQNDLWTVCYIEDGDTLWVWGNHPDTGERTVRNVRLKFIDTPETYSLYENSDYNTGGIAPLPNGQDSYRPSSVRYGEIAKNALGEQLEEAQVKIDWHGTGHYGRYLAVIHKGELNINLWMVKEGYAFARTSNDPQESQNYLFAEAEARGEGNNGPKGIWNSQTVVLEGLPAGFPTSVKSNIEKLMEPWDFRMSYKSDSTGGFDNTTAQQNCSQATWEEAPQDDPGGADPDTDS